jgi:hypothetical protein
VGVHTALFAPFTPSRNPRLRTLLFLALALLTTCNVTRGEDPAPLPNDGSTNVVQCQSGGKVNGILSLNKLDRHEK